ncbi:MAG: SLC13 family permease [Pseudomonadota bacterium]
MTENQIILFSLLGVVFALLIWGRFRYDVVAFAALIIAVIVGVVPKDAAFDGFGHPATIIIALVLIVSKGLSNSGAVDVIARTFVDAGRSVWSHISIMAGLGAAMSALMNNVGALALLMPVDLQAAEKAKRSPAITLMPLSFATILGGLITLIGTPPNIIISSYRNEQFGEPFKMFDFAPVGLACAVAGVAFVAFIGWRLLPKSTREREAGKELFETGTYLVELRVTQDSTVLDKQISDLHRMADEHDAAPVGVLRSGSRLQNFARWVRLEVDDVILMETKAAAVDALVNDLKLTYAQAEEERRVALGEDVETQRVRVRRAEAIDKDIDKDAASSDLGLMEVAVRPDSFVEGRTAQSLRLQDQSGVWLVGISRQGKKLTGRVRHTRILAGDVLLLMGPNQRLRAASDWLETLPLADRGLQVTDRGQALFAGAIFAAAILAASVGWLYLPVALGAVVIAYVLSGIVPLRGIYDTIEWPVIVLIASLLPIGAALEASGGTQLIAQGIADISLGAPAWVVLTLVMVVTMTLSDILNNTATAVIAAPVAVGVANALGVNPDPFLMAVAVAASCAFLTPIGHKNNTLIMGPGGYRFGDYWRMGLPLEIVVIAVAVPMILLVWPL